MSVKIRIVISEIVKVKVKITNVNQPLNCLEIVQKRCNTWWTTAVIGVTYVVISKRELIQLAQLSFMWQMSRHYVPHLANVSVIMAYIPM